MPQLPPNLNKSIFPSLKLPAELRILVYVELLISKVLFMAAKKHISSHSPNVSVGAPGSSSSIVWRECA